VNGGLLTVAIFDASHGCEGVARRLPIEIFQLIFWLPACRPKSLRPGMMAHAHLDGFDGAVLRMLK
jgi:hypothetical protein